MAFPSGTKIATESMDPYELMDYGIDCTPLLRPGESIATWSLNLLPESTLLGLEIGTGVYAPLLVYGILYFWVSVIPAERETISYFVGNVLPMELSFTTDSIPPRRRQRTVAIRIGQK